MKLARTWKLRPSTPPRTVFRCAVPPRADALRAAFAWRPAAVLVLVAVSWTSGCASSNTALIVRNEVSVTVVNPPKGGRPVAIDPQDPRISAAAKALGELLPRPLAYAIDGSVAVQLGANLQQQAIEMLEGTVRALRAMKIRSPRLFAMATERLRRMEFAYAPGDDAFTTKLAADGALRVTVPPRAQVLLPEWGVHQAFSDAFDEERARRFSNLEPRAVPPNEHADCFDFWTRYLPKGIRRGDAYGVYRLRQIARVLELASVVRDPALARNVQRWLVAQGDVLASEEPAAPERAPLRAAWSAWMDAHAAALSDDERVALAELLLSPPAWRLKGRSVAWAKLDWLALAQPVLETWVREPDAEEVSPAVKVLLCPLEKSSSKRCSGGVWTTTAPSPDGLRRIATLLVRHRHRLLTTSAVAAVLRGQGLPSALELSKMLESDPVTFGAALVGLADGYDWSESRSSTSSAPDVPRDPRMAIDYLRSLWKTYREPDRRGPILYALVRLAKQREGLLRLGRLAEELGGPITGPELASLLDQAPLSIDLFVTVSSSLAHFPRAPILGPRIERWFDEHRSKKRSPDYLNGFFESVCATSHWADVADLARRLRARVESHPSEARYLGRIVSDQDADRCPNDTLADRERRAQRTARTPVLFGD